MGRDLYRGNKSAKKAKAAGTVDKPKYVKVMEERLVEVREKKRKREQIEKERERKSMKKAEESKLRETERDSINGIFSKAFLNKTWCQIFTF